MLTSDDKGMAPMDIDRVQDKGKKGKGKTKDGKSKGKGKDNKGSKGKGDGVGTKKAAPRGKQSSWKDDRGKGKVCYTCGKPVPKDWRVRQVAENPQSSTASTGGGTSNAARDDASAAALSAHANRASAKRVSQASWESVSQASLDPFVVDLRELDEDRGVTRAVQFFFMEDGPRELKMGAVRATADADDGFLESEEHGFQ